MRDDLNKLPLPPEAKSYARRSGLSAMKKQPQSFINMAAAVSNQRSKKHGFKNTDEVGTVPKAIKECASLIVAMLIETENPHGFFEYRVYPDATKSLADELTYNIQVPTEHGTYVNKVFVPDPLDEKGIAEIETRMRQLAAQRKYPDEAFFTTPWGDYLIHAGRIGKI